MKNSYKSFFIVVLILICITKTNIIYSQEQDYNTNNSVGELSQNNPAVDIPEINLKDVIQENKEIILKWENPQYELLDKIEISIEPGSSKIYIDAQKKEARISNLENNQEYTFTIKTININNESSKGIEVKGIPMMLPNPFSWISELFRDPFIRNLIVSIIIIIILNFVRIIVLKIIHKRFKQDVKKYYKIRKVISYVSVVVGIVSVGSLWFSFIDNIITFLGLVSAGIAISLKDLVSNMAGWIFIVWRKPFKVGDRIEIGENAGDVIDIRLFQFTVMEIGNWVDSDQSTGRIIHVPNFKVISEPLANYGKSFNFIWNEIPVVVTFESNWKKAKNILTDIINNQTKDLNKEAEEKIKEASRKFMVVYTKLTPIVYTKVIDFGVKLTIRYLCEPRQRRTTENNIWEDILSIFNQNSDIMFAYPTYRNDISFNKLAEKEQKQE